MTDTFSITPLGTLSPEEISGLGAVLDALPENVRAVIAGYEVRIFLRDTLAPAFSLTEAQHRGVARFIMEAVMHPIPTSQTAGELSRAAAIDRNTAAQIVKELEMELLAPLELTLTGLASPAREPDVVRNEQGNEGLRYDTLEDLMADLEPLAPGDRVKFLNDAKPFNLIFVLQALSQLKMGASVGGQPLTFRQLVVQEASAFSPQDWVDLATTNPDSLGEPNIMPRIATTPLGAMLQGKDPIASRQTVLRFLELPSDAQLFLFEPSTLGTLTDMANDGALPPTHVAAAGKLLAFLLLGDVTPPQVRMLLEKLDVPSAQAARAAVILVDMAKPFMPTAELPTRQAPPPPVPPPPANPQKKNVIDLRNRPPAT